MAASPVTHTEEMQTYMVTASVACRDNLMALKCSMAGRVYEQNALPQPVLQVESLTEEMNVVHKLVTCHY